MSPYYRSTADVNIVTNYCITVLRYAGDKLVVMNVSATNISLQLRLHKKKHGYMDAFA
jgi:hypothetical protein